MEIRLGDNTATAVEGAPTVLVPLGGLRDQGRGLPLDAETEVAVAVADLVAKALNRRGRACVVAPALSFGSAEPDRGSPGQITLSEPGLCAVVQGVVESAATWADQVILVTLDARTTEILASAAVSWDVGQSSARVMRGDLSAHGVETIRAWTSLMLFLKPWNVRLDGRRGYRAVARMGADSGGASGEAMPSADEGRELLDTLAWQLIGELGR